MNQINDSKANEKRDDVRVWLDIVEDAINTTMEQLEEYKEQNGEHGEIEAMIYEGLDLAIGHIQDAQGEMMRLPK